MFVATTATLGDAQIFPLVDTFIGTGGLGCEFGHARSYLLHLLRFHAIGSFADGVGGSPPGAQYPFGAMRLSPDTSLGPAWFFFE